jgi:hypothetical protein
MREDPRMEVAHLNGLIATFGEHHKTALRAEKRASASSPLFDLLRRSLVGYHLKWDHTAAFLREVAEVLSPEEVGRRMKRPGMRPYYMQHFLLMQDILSGRQQRMLELGLAPGDPFPGERLDDLAFVADFWERSCRAYRNDGGLFPAADRSQPILDEVGVAEVTALLEPFDADVYRRARRVLATLDGYSFLAHGEQRDGIFGHGPYDGADGTVLFLKEVNDLRNDLLPWTQTATRNLLDNVVFAYECRDVQVTCDFFGGIVAEPLDYTDRIERFVVLTNDGGSLRTVPQEEWSGIVEAATEATNEIYFDVVGWDPRMKAGYGAMLFANHLKPFCDLAGIDANDRLAAAARDTVDRYLDEVLAGPPAPLVMVHWGTTEGPLFWPAVA